MQAMGNAYYAYIHLNNFQGWIELFGLVEEELIYQKRVLSIVSGAILPIVALGFIKSLVDYIKPDQSSLGTVDEALSEKQIVIQEIEPVIVEETQPSETIAIDQPARIDNLGTIDSRIARGGR
jgi:hypothetical protein